MLIGKRIYHSADAVCLILARDGSYWGAAVSWHILCAYALMRAAAAIENDTTTSVCLFSRFPSMCLFQNFCMHATFVYFNWVTSFCISRSLVVLLFVADWNEKTGDRAYNNCSKNGKMDKPSLCIANEKKEEKTKTVQNWIRGNSLTCNGSPLALNTLKH